MPRDPRLSLVRLVARLEQRAAYVSLDDIERAAARRPTRALPVEQIRPLVEEAVVDYLLLVDRRTFFDRQTQTFEDRYVYRVNWRHPVAKGINQTFEE